MRRVQHRHLRPGSGIEPQEALHLQVRHLPHQKPISLASFHSKQLNSFIVRHRLELISELPHVECMSSMLTERRSDTALTLTQRDAEPMHPMVSHAQA